MKLTVIGGGYTYTPELIDGLSRLRELLLTEELWLVDPDAHRLELVAGVSRRMFARAGYPGTITATRMSWPASRMPTSCCCGFA